MPRISGSHLNNEIAPPLRAAVGSARFGSARLGAAGKEKFGPGKRTRSGRASSRIPGGDERPEGPTGRDERGERGGRDSGDAAAAAAAAATAAAAAPLNIVFAQRIQLTGHV